jgi:hypothetical protein
MPHPDNTISSVKATADISVENVMVACMFDPMNVSLQMTLSLPVDLLLSLGPAGGYLQMYTEDLNIESSLKTVFYPD